MNVILLSGGSGTRLWPLSNEQKPKQFLQIFTDAHGNATSMLQNVWGRLERRGLARTAVIATSRSQRELIYEQIGHEVDLVLEPEKRDTFPAILLSLAYLCSHRGVGPEEAVAVMPVDSRAEEGFYDALLELPGVLERSGAQLVVMGVKPTHPSEKYGYLLPQGEADSNGVLRVQSFREKPAADEAIRLVEVGALWNCGVFCFRAGYLLDRLHQMGLPDTYEELLLSYDRLDPRSFDYAVAERERSIVALTYRGEWKDLGTWCSLTEEMPEAVRGRGHIEANAENVHIMNELDIPAVVMGLSDVVVAASSKGILVAHKSASDRLKETLRQMNAEGSERLDSAELWSKPLDSSVFADGTTVSTRRLHLSQGTELVYEATPGRGSVSWTIIHGKVRVSRAEGDQVETSSGAGIVLGPSERAVLYALEPLDLIEIATIYKIE